MTLARICVANRKPKMSTKGITNVSTAPMPTVTIWRLRSTPATFIGKDLLLLRRQLEADGRPHGHLDRCAVDDYRLIVPMLDSRCGRLVEDAWRRRFDHAYITRLTVRVDDILDSHATT